MASTEDHVILKESTHDNDDSNPSFKKKKRNVDNGESDGGGEIQLKGFDFADPQKVEKMTKENQFNLRKSVAQCMIDLGLFAANISQLRIILKAGVEKVQFYYFLLVCVSISLALQIIFALIVIIIWGREEKTENGDTETATPAINSGTDHVTIKKDKVVNALNCMSVIIVLSVTLINVCISGFGIEILTP